MKHEIRGTSAIGLAAMDTVPTEPVCAINEMPRHGGLAPAHWALAEFPRATSILGNEAEIHDIETTQAHADAPTVFVLQSEFSAKARTAFTERDCGTKIQRGIPTNATLVLSKSTHR